MKKRVTITEVIALFVAVIGIIGLIFICFKFASNTYLINSSEEFTDNTIGITSALGSLISGIGALFSLASVLYFVAALKISQRDLQETAKTQSLHQFENTFFKLIDLHNTIVENLVFPGSKGRDVFGSAKMDLKGSNQYYYMKDNSGMLTRISHEFSPPPSTIEAAKAKLENDYVRTYYNRYQFTLNHYFRTLYHVFKYLYLSNLTQEQKKTYAAIARSQLSQDELYLIMFNSLIDGYGYPKMLFLVKEFTILDNFDDKEVYPCVYYQLFIDELHKVSNPF
ncbi:MAG TPA: hypothetical protein DIT07_16895 [Sphingobacteriaceae bacterium]|nr:hypothetical protein [Sphingobacteriaceae bacterium]